MMIETSLSKTEPDVIVGTPICRRTSFILDKFLSNQQEIQQAYPGCRLVLATDEPDFVAELKEQINHYHLKGKVITYETVKPDYARSHYWSVACGREALRQYALPQGAECLLFLDSDMVYEPSVISIMKDKIQDFDVVFSGYRLFPLKGGWVFAGGCLLINREILNKITFRCHEFKNGEMFTEDDLFQMDLFKHRARVNKGIFVSINHYRNNQEYYAIEPQPMGWFRRVTNNLLLRYMVSKMNMLARHHIFHKLRVLLGQAAKVKLKR
ncbi:glycosyltransferase family A protein [Chloroflexota bacterium]